jgi:two-component system, OmpR family, response regulator QseB
VSHETPTTAVRTRIADRVDGRVGVLPAAVGALLALAVAWIHVTDQGGFPGDKSPAYIAIGYYVLELVAVVLAVALLTPATRNRLGTWLLAAAVGAGPMIGYALTDTGTSLLLVEDDRDLAAMLTRLLGEEGYDVTHAPDGQRGLHLGLTRTFALLVIDRGLPAIDGLDLLSRLRGRGIGSPALVLSARGSTADRVDGLDAGAEDYLTKPFDVEELLARLRALQRRHTATAPVLTLGRRVLDIQSRLVLEPDADPASGVALSERECQLLEVLARRPSRVFSRSELLELVFTDAGSEVAADTYVHYCRRKLGRDVIRTVRGLGYQLGSA